MSLHCPTTLLVLSPGSIPPAERRIARVYAADPGADVGADLGAGFDPDLVADLHRGETVVLLANSFLGIPAPAEFEHDGAGWLHVHPARTPVRAGVLLLSDQGVAAIERIRDGLRYHVLPGGRLDPGETSAQAAVREAREELGVEVRLVGRIAEVIARDGLQHYYAAELVSGVFGTGDGEEMNHPPDSPHGTYRAVWLPTDQLVAANLKPPAIAAALQTTGHPQVTAWLAHPLQVDETTQP
ncbi:NUDIX domain-containing protein [Kribbella deserti]|uniref:NUDIX domain-containing protein n=1 Tax=Kribbella deserti TaxID=1926257 RepID=A0ABV6QK69_9ACTN